MTEVELIVALLAAMAAFLISSTVGLGGSLVMVPAMVLVLGTKEGVAMAALLLAFNNVAKLVAYRDVLPIRRAAWAVVVPTMVGAYLGSRLLVAAPESWVTAAVIASLAASFLVEWRTGSAERRVGAPLLAGASGLTSGFSGTSGPLKGVAVRGLGLDPRFTVGAASLASFAGDATKAGVFVGEGILEPGHLAVAAALIPVMVLCTVGGYRINLHLGTRGYAACFWTVVLAYSARLLGVLG
jgi:uncharacterized membrane protein YfcA